MGKEKIFPRCFDGINRNPKVLNSTQINEDTKLNYL